MNDDMEYAEGRFLPIMHDTDSKYFDLYMPPNHLMDAEHLLEIMEFHLSLVPKIYRENQDVWGIYNLDDYQEMAAAYISIKAWEKNYGESIHTKDRPFIT